MVFLPVGPVFQACSGSIKFGTDVVVIADREVQHSTDRDAGDLASVSFHDRVHVEHHIGDGLHLHTMTKCYVHTNLWFHIV